MRIIKYILLVLAITLQSCGGSDDSSAPAPTELGTFNLIFPNNNEVCTEGIDLSNDMVEIPFRWASSTNATSYSIEVTDTETGQNYNTTSNTTSTEIALPKGTQFTWSVTAVSRDNIKDSNANWNFYSEGITTSNHIPFPAKITLEDNKNGTINILWEGLDLDDDIDTYEVYAFNNFTGGNPQLIANTKETSITNFEIIFDTEYFLQVITKDKNGNSSNSKKTFMFRN